MAGPPLVYASFHTFDKPPPHLLMPHLPNHGGGEGTPLSKRLSCLKDTPQFGLHFFFFFYTEPPLGQGGGGTIMEESNRLGTLRPAHSHVKSHGQAIKHFKEIQKHPSSDFISFLFSFPLLDCPSPPRPAPQSGTCLPGPLGPPSGAATPLFPPNPGPQSDISDLISNSAQAL